MAQCITSYQAKYFAHSLTRRLPANDGAKFTATLQDARVDLTPWPFACRYVSDIPYLNILLVRLFILSLHTETKE